MPLTRTLVRASIRSITTLLPFTLTPTVLPAQSAAPNGALATALTDDLMKVARLPGISVAALREKSVVYARGTGLRDVARGLPVDSSTVFASASVAKVVTATAALSLMQQGRFDIDEPVGRRFPDFPGPRDRITPRLLAAHLGGIPHYGLGSLPTEDPHTTASKALGVFAAAPRVGEPGERSVYSTHGITLLTAMMEQATGRPILDILRTEVFTPYAMRSSGGMHADSLPSSLTTPYMRAGDEYRALPGWRNTSYAWGAAGLALTPVDLVRMTRPYFDGTFTQATLRTAFEEQRTRDGAPTGIGFIWRVERDWRGRPLAHHAGISAGTRTVLLMRREQAQSVAIMVNVDWNSSIERTANVLAEALFDSAPRRNPVRVQGTWRGMLDSVEVQGSWSIDGDTGSVSVPPALRERFQRTGGVTADRLPVRAIRDDLYALVTPWGLSPMEIVRDARGVHATVQVASQRWTLVATP